MSKINAAVDRLTSASHKLAEAMYKQASTAHAAQEAPGGAPGASSSASGAAGAQGKSKGDGEVIDAEVVDGDDKKKN